MPQRAMPVRADRWRPGDRIYDGILARSVADAEATESRDGTAELMAGAVVLAVLAVAVLIVTQSAGAALGVLLLGGAAVFGFTVFNAKPAAADRGEVLLTLGGPGRLPAGYLVDPVAWEAGLAEHVAGIPESQLRAAADMCHLYPGTVNDLVNFVGHIAIHVPPPHEATPEAVAKRAREITRIGLPLLKEHVKTTPALPQPAGKK